MATKLLTLKELSEYLGIKEEKITELVEKKVILAYKIGGELLRFRREQLDATRREIESRVTDADRIVPDNDVVAPSENHGKLSDTWQEDDTFRDRVADFFHFNDFYIVSVLFIFLLLYVIYKY